MLQDQDAQSYVLPPHFFLLCFTACALPSTWPNRLNKLKRGANQPVKTKSWMLMRWQKESDRLRTPLSATLLSDGAHTHATAAFAACNTAASSVFKARRFLLSGNLI